jgi:ABC-2 type transport system permease protein
MKSLRHIWFIALNNLRLFLTDRLALGMFFAFPFLFIIMFNLLLSNTGVKDTRLELHLATLETDGISLHLIQSMATADPAKLDPGKPVIIWDRDYNQARADVEANKLSGFLAFPADFTQKVMSGQTTNLEIIAQSEATEVRMALNGLAQGIASEIRADNVEIASVSYMMMQQGVSQAEIQKKVSQIIQNHSSDANTPSLITYQANSIGEAKPVNTSSFVVPGYLVMFVFFASAIASVEIIRERRNHTLERLMASSVRKESILGGIYLGAFFRGLVQIIIFWTVGILVFHVNLGIAPWAVILLSLLVVLMSAAFSLMLATIVKSERGASGLAVLCSVLLAPLGGCWWPLFIDPKWMQFLAKFTPHGWANDGFNKLMLFGANGSDVIWQMLALVGFAAAFIIVAVINFRTTADAV